MPLRTMFFLITVCIQTSLFAQAQLYTAADVERDYRSSFSDQPQFFWLNKAPDSVRARRLKSITLISEYMSEGKNMLSRSTSYYDETGRMVKSIDRGQYNNSTTTSYSPDGRSMLHTISGAGTQNGRDSIYFNDQHRVVKVISWRKGELPQRCFYTYDQAQRIIHSRWVQGKQYYTVELRYNSHNLPGFRLEMQGKEGAPADTVKFTQVACDTQGRIVSKRVTSNTLSHTTRWHTYRYDEGGHLLFLGERSVASSLIGAAKTSEATSNHETTFNYSYDANGRLQKEELNSGDSCPSWSWKEHHYSASADTVFTYGCKTLAYSDFYSTSKPARPVVMQSVELFIKDTAGRLIEWQALSPELSVLTRQQSTYDAAGRLLEYRLSYNPRYEEPYILRQHKFNEKGLEIESTEMEDGQLKEHCRYEYTFY